MHLFLDFDGVLHPDEAYLIKGRPMLKKAGQLFMWAGLLEGMIADLPTVQIVLSTSWARQLGYSRAKRYLPLGLRSRVIGATWHSAMGKYDGLQRPDDVTWWDAASRYQQIKQYAISAKLTEWVAIDDQTQGWGVDDLDKLVQTDSKTGLSDGHVQALLAERLGRLGSPQNGAIFKARYQKLLDFSLGKKPYLTLMNELNFGSDEDLFLAMCGAGLSMPTLPKEELDKMEQIFVGLGL